MAIISVCLASLFLAIANFLMRKSIDAGGKANAYLLIQLSICFLISIMLGPVKENSYSINSQIAFFGLLTGIVLIVLLATLGKALETGPSGLTFSILSAAAVFPILIMVAFFGKAYGFFYTPWHAIGSFFVLIGLFWAGKYASDPAPQVPGVKQKKIWIFLVSAMFILHILLLVLYQGRALILSMDPFPFLLSREKMNSAWFVPMMYAGAVAIQLGTLLKTQKRWPNKKEWIYGSFGGFFNSLCTFFLLQGTQSAHGLQHSIIFPLYSIGTIFFSNLWSQWFYNEKVHWRACQVCMAGIFLGSIDWKALL